MLVKLGTITLLACAISFTFAACGARGLPPAGPAEGEVDVGYDTRDEKDVTGAVTSVSGEDIGRSRPVNLEELLRGKVAGLQILRRPDGGYTFRIRGLGSMQEGQPEPLFVVDDVKMSGNDLESALAGLTRDDIKQVDVLKDVASTSIYGMRGAGGVIIITTTRR